MEDGARFPKDRAEPRPSRIPLATRVMSNGVEVIVAGAEDQTKPEQSKMRRVTLNPTTLKNNVKMATPAPEKVAHKTSSKSSKTSSSSSPSLSSKSSASNKPPPSQKSSNSPISKNPPISKVTNPLKGHAPSKVVPPSLLSSSTRNRPPQLHHNFIIKTCFTTFTYLTTIIHKTGTMVSTYESVVSTVTTEPLSMTPTQSMFHVKKTEQVEMFTSTKPAHESMGSLPKIEKRIDDLQDLSDHDIIQPSEVGPKTCLMTSCPCTVTLTESLKDRTKTAFDDDAPEQLKRAPLDRTSTILDISPTATGDKKDKNTKYRPSVPPGEKIVQKYTEISSEGQNDDNKKTDKNKNNKNTPTADGDKLKNNRNATKANEDKRKPQNGQGDKNKIPQKQPVKTNFQVADLLKLGTLGIKKLAPMIEQMTGTLKRRQEMNKQATTVRPATVLTPYIVNKRVDSIEGQGGDHHPPGFPIYIPVDEQDIETAESQYSYSNTTLQHNIAWATQNLKNSRTNIGFGKPIHESPLLNGGIPISPGEIITANSDVIVGRPAVGGPNIGHIGNQNINNQNYQDSHIQSSEFSNVKARPPQRGQGIKQIPIIRDDSYDLRPPMMTMPRPQFNQHNEQQSNLPHGIPFNQNSIPINQNNIPINQNIIPINQNSIPVNQNNVPVSQNNIPINQGRPQNDLQLEIVKSESIPYFHGPSPATFITNEQHNAFEGHIGGSIHPPVQNNHGKATFLDHVPSLGTQASYQNYIKNNLITRKNHDDNAALLNSLNKNKQNTPKAKPQDNKHIPISGDYKPVYEVSEPIFFTDLGQKTSAKPLLVDIQPSRVANVIIPHGSTSALIFAGSSEPHKNGEYIDDPLPYQEPGYFGSFSIDAPHMTAVHVSGTIPLKDNIQHGNNQRIPLNSASQTHEDQRVHFNGPPRKNPDPYVINHGVSGLNRDVPPTGQRWKFEDGKHVQNNYPGNQNNGERLPPPISNQESNLHFGPHQQMNKPHGGNNFAHPPPNQFFKNGPNNIKPIPTDYESELAVPPPPPPTVQVKYESNVGVLNSNFEQKPHFGTNLQERPHFVNQDRPPQQNFAAHDNHPQRVTSEVYFATSNGESSHKVKPFTVNIPASSNFNTRPPNQHIATQENVHFPADNTKFINTFDGGLVTLNAGTKVNLHNAPNPGNQINVNNRHPGQTETHLNIPQNGGLITLNAGATVHGGGNFPEHTVAGTSINVPILHQANNQIFNTHNIKEFNSNVGESTGIPIGTNFAIKVEPQLIKNYDNGHAGVQGVPTSEFKLHSKGPEVIVGGNSWKAGSGSEEDEYLTSHNGGIPDSVQNGNEKVHVVHASTIIQQSETKYSGTNQNNENKKPVTFSNSHANFPVVKDSSAEFNQFNQFVGVPTNNGQQQNNGNQIVHNTGLQNGHGQQNAGGQYNNNGQNIRGQANSGSQVNNGGQNNRGQPNSGGQVNNNPQNNKGQVSSGNQVNNGQNNREQVNNDQNNRGQANSGNQVNNGGQNNRGSVNNGGQNNRGQPNSGNQVNNGGQNNRGQGNNVGQNNRGQANSGSQANNGGQNNRGQNNKQVQQDVQNKNFTGQQRPVIIDNAPETNYVVRPNNNQGSYLESHRPVQPQPNRENMDKSNNRLHSYQPTVKVESTTHKIIPLTFDYEGERYADFDKTGQFGQRLPSNTNKQEPFNWQQQGRPVLQPKEKPRPHDGIPEFMAPPPLTTQAYNPAYIPGNFNINRQPVYDIPTRDEAVYFTSKATERPRFNTTNYAPVHNNYNQYSTDTSYKTIDEESLQNTVKGEYGQPSGKVPVLSSTPSLLSNEVTIKYNKPFRNASAYPRDEILVSSENDYVHYKIENGRPTFNADDNSGSQTEQPFDANKYKEISLVTLPGLRPTTKPTFSIPQFSQMAPRPFAVNENSKENNVYDNKDLPKPRPFNKPTTKKETENLILNIGEVSAKPTTPTIVLAEKPGSTASTLLSSSLRPTISLKNNTLTFKKETDKIITSTVTFTTAKPIKIVNATIERLPPSVPTYSPSTTKGTNDSMIIPNLSPPPPTIDYSFRPTNNDETIMGMSPPPKTPAPKPTINDYTKHNEISTYRPSYNILKNPYKRPGDYHRITSRPFTRYTTPSASVIMRPKPTGNTITKIVFPSRSTSWKNPVRIDSKTTTTITTINTSPLATVGSEIMHPEIYPEETAGFLSPTVTKSYSDIAPQRVQTPNIYATIVQQSGSNLSPSIIRAPSVVRRPPVLQSSENYFNENTIKPTESLNVAPTIVLNEDARKPIKTLIHKFTAPSIVAPSRSIADEELSVKPIHHAGNEIKQSDVEYKKNPESITAITYTTTLSEPASTVMTTKFLTLTHTLTVTQTQTSIVSPTAGSTTQTLVLTNTQTSTVIDVVTEIHTLVQPTTIVQTITKHVPITPLPAWETKYPKVPIEPTHVREPPFRTKDIIDLDDVSLSSSEEDLIITPDNSTTIDLASPEDAGSDRDQDNFFVVMNKSQNGGTGPKINPTVDTDFDVATRNEEVGNDGVSHVLLGEILLAGTPYLESGVSPTGVAYGKDCQPECKASRNERCQRVRGLMKCVCRPGFARMFPDRPCKPTYTYSLKLALSRYRSSPLLWESALGDPTSPARQALAAAAHEGLNRMVMQSDLRDVFHGVHVNGFQPISVPSRGGAFQGVMNDFYVQLSDNAHETRLKEVMEKYLRTNNYSLGGTDVYASAELLDQLEVGDFNECHSAQFHDCSEHAECFNLQATYTCSCREGYADLSVNPRYPGRACSAEAVGCERCHYHGTCYSRGEGKELCECFQWYAGETCQVNLKVILISLSTLGAILLLVLLFCLVMACSRKRRPRQHHPPAPRPGSTMPACLQSAHQVGLQSSKLHPIDKRALIQERGNDSGGEGSSIHNASLPYIPAKKISQVSHKSSKKLSLSDEPGRDKKPFTLMIPRAKYCPAPATSPLLIATDHRDSARDGARDGSGGGKRKSSSGESSNEAKLLSYLDAGPNHNEHARRKQSNESSYSINKNLHQKYSTGALVSAGFKVSTTVMNTGGGGDGDSCIKDVPDDTSSMSKSHLDMDLHLDMQQHFNKAYSHDDNMTDWTDAERRIGELTMSEARSFDGTLVKPATKMMRSTTGSNKSSQHYTQHEANTMAERDLGSTFLLPHVHLYKPDMGSDVSEFDSL